MKKSLIIISCILLSSNIAYSESINVKVETKIYLVPNNERYLEIKNQKMLHAIAERQWITQNEKCVVDIFNDYDLIEKEFIKKGLYKETVETLEYYDHHSSSRVNRLLGFAYFKLGDYINAIKNYNYYIKSNKVINPLIYYERGLARFKINDYSGAIEDYNFAVKNGLPVDDTFLTGEKIFDYTRTEHKSFNNNLDIKINSFLYSITFKLVIITTRKLL